MDVPSYSGVNGPVRWAGIVVTPNALEELKRSTLPERLKDLAAVQDLLSEVSAMASTDMGVETIQQIIAASDSPPTAWEVGEALAESILQDTHGAVWPWNSGRDRRTPRASLPGADLVGFIDDASGPMLLFGEVKTSNDGNSPPNVLYGRTGMTHQLEQLYADPQLHFTLIRWLRPRCVDPQFKNKWKKAVQRFVNSGSKDYVLVGCLLRDTTPRDSDLKSRAEKLAGIITTPTKVWIFAWYINEAIDTWPTWTLGQESA
jgi:hypothetical protein